MIDAAGFESTATATETYDYLWETAPQEQPADNPAPDETQVSVEEMAATGDSTVAAPSVHGEADNPTTNAVPRLLLSTGESFALNRAAIVGRLPSIRATGESDPVLIAVPSPDGDISRNHLHVYLEESIVLVRDLDSTNGTLLRRAGEPTVRIAVDAPTLVRDGDVFDLGEAVTVSFEGLR